MTHLIDRGFLTEYLGKALIEFDACQGRTIAIEEQEITIRLQGNEFC
jgi:hypothetical protein